MNIITTSRMPSTSVLRRVLSEGNSTRIFLASRKKSIRYFSGSLNPFQLAASQAQSMTNFASDDSSRFMLILGKPGGGKGTISKKILKDFPRFAHLSTGDILRQHVRNQSAIGIEAKKHMDNGGLVPNEVMIDLVMEGAGEYIRDGKSLLLDGFPRTMEQAVALDERLDVDLVIDLHVPTETIVERIADRWIHPASGRVYNYSYNPPSVYGKDDETGDDLVQRDDDKPETVRKRLDAYDEVTAPLVDYYARKGVLKSFHGTMSDVIYPEVKAWLQDEMYLSARL